MGERLEDLERLVGVAAAEQQPSEADRGPRVAGIQLERLAQRLLVAGLRQPIGLRRSTISLRKLSIRAVG